MALIRFAAQITQPPVENLIVKNSDWKGIIMKIVTIMLIISLGAFFLNCQKSPKNQTQSSTDKLNIQANLVFLYYKDLARAQDFYENVLGLNLAADYGFAKIFQISQSSFVGLVDENEGMHKSTEPKTVTLSFVTEEIDEWYNYLQEKNVRMKGPIGNATRHPTRGFVAYDPEGYFLEFETFLDDPQNTKLRAKFVQTKAIYPDPNKKGGRPKNLGVQGNVIWLYYKDIPTTQKFYEEKFGLELLVDQGFAKVYSSSPTSFIGLVDGSQGLHRFSEEKAVTISFLTNTLEEWFEHLKNKNVEMRTPEIEMESGSVRVFVCYDIGGYFIEFDHFLPDEKNERLLKILER